MVFVYRYYFGIEDGNQEDTSDDVGAKWKLKAMWSVVCVWEGDNKACQVFIHLQETCEQEVWHIIVDTYGEHVRFARRSYWR